MNKMCIFNDSIRVVALSLGKFHPFPFDSNKSFFYEPKHNNLNHFFFHSVCVSSMASVSYSFQDNFNCIHVIRRLTASPNLTCISEKAKEWQRERYVRRKLWKAKNEFEISRVRLPPPNVSSHRIVHLETQTLLCVVVDILNNGEMEKKWSFVNFCVGISIGQKHRNMSCRMMKRSSHWQDWAYRKGHHSKWCYFSHSNENKPYSLCRCSKRRVSTQKTHSEHIISHFCVYSTVMALVIFQT